MRFPCYQVNRFRVIRTGNLFNSHPKTIICFTKHAGHFRSGVCVSFSQFSLSACPCTSSHSLLHSSATHNFLNISCCFMVPYHRVHIPLSPPFLADKCLLFLDLTKHYLPFPKSQENDCSLCYRSLCTLYLHGHHDSVIAVYTSLFPISSCYS